MEITEYKEKMQKEMEAVLYDLIKNWEDEVVEFKEASNDFDKDKIGRYFSHSVMSPTYEACSMDGLFLA